jgi:hypothetical protein
MGEGKLRHGARRSSIELAERTRAAEKVLVF